MNALRASVVPAVAVLIVLASGCAARTVDFASIDRPDRSGNMDAYEVFIGSWTWEAEMVNAEEPDKNWTGTATWEWGLDKRCLKGELAARSKNAEFEAAGVWSWHPKKKKYIWWMFNNWGYPQEGTAKYDADAKCWTMNYRSVGLDGGTSYGRYRMTVVDDDTLDWSAEEWADPLRLVKKMEMKGAYKRK